MKQTLSMFDSYIAVRVEVDTDDIMKDERPYWGYNLPVRKVWWAKLHNVTTPFGGTRKSPDWKTSEPVEGFEHSLILGNIDGSDVNRAIEQASYGMGDLLFALEDHFCQVGKCVINIHTCPESKGTSR